jgi:hypothetical protein
VHARFGLEVHLVAFLDVECGVPGVDVALGKVPRAMNGECGL